MYLWIGRVMLNPQEQAAADAISETELRVQEFELRKQELQWQKDQLRIQHESEDKRWKAQAAQRVAEIKDQAAQREADSKLQVVQRELELKFQMEARLLREAELKALAEQNAVDCSEHAKEVAAGRQLREAEIKLCDQAAKQQSDLRMQEMRCNAPVTNARRKDTVHSWDKLNDSVI
jgi:hypothetical protein